MYYSINEIYKKLCARRRLFHNCIKAAQTYKLGPKFVLSYCFDKKKYKKTLKHIIHNILQKYDEKYIEDKTVTVKKLEEKEYTIWVMWWQGIESMPEIIRACYERLLECADSYRVVFICKRNVEEYLSIPDNIKEKLDREIISQTELANYIRVALLKQYGGLWVDASLYCMKKISDIEKLRLLTGKKVEGMKWTTFLMGTNEINNSIFLRLEYYFRKYWEDFDILLDYFIFDLFIEYLYEDHEDIHEMFDAVPENNRGIWRLLKLLSSPYDEELFRDIAKQNMFQKLSYKKDFKLHKNGKDTFGKALLKENCIR